MKITIIKYTADNYFSLESTWIDTIVMQGLVEIPHFDESNEHPLEFSGLKPRGYAVKISLLQTDISKNGLTIKDFLLPETDRDVTFVCEVDMGSRKIYGKIDNNSRIVDLNYIKGWDVSFSMKGLEQEWKDHVSAFYPDQMTVLPGDLTLNNHLSSFTSTGGLFYRAGNHQWVVDNQTVGYLESLYGVSNTVAPKISCPLQNKIMGSDGKPNCYEALLSIANTLGFKFRLDYWRTHSYGWDARYDFKLVLFFPMNIISETAITGLEIIEHKETQRAFNKKTIFRPTSKLFKVGGNWNTLDVRDWYFGTAIDNTGEYRTAAEELFEWVYGSAQQFIDTTKILYYNRYYMPSNTTYLFKDFEILDVGNFYSVGSLLPRNFPNNYTLSCSITYGRCVVKNYDYIDYEPIWYNDFNASSYLATSFLRESAFYLQGMRTRKELIVRFNSSDAPQMYRRVTLDEATGTKNYYIIAVKDVDFINNTCSLELEQL